MHWDELLSAERINKKTREDPSRSAFEVDYDRIVFSTPFRRLQDKTQVFPFSQSTFVHTRLTHSLEVASVGRSLGRMAGHALIDKYGSLKRSGIEASDFGAIVSTACLSHDLGNPPFGHSGEKAISEYFRAQPSMQADVSKAEWNDLLQFEGNAQGFRILNKENYQGLNLTYASVCAFTKYPCESTVAARRHARKSQNKYGIYQSELEKFRQVAEKTGLLALTTDRGAAWARPPLAFLMEAADDICYSIIDLEDGCNLGLVTTAEAIDLLAGILEDDFNKAKLNQVRGKSEQISLLRALVIGKLIHQYGQVFLEHEEAIMQGTFDQSLTAHVPGKVYLKEIIKLSIDKIYRSERVLEKELIGYDILHGLLEELVPLSISHWLGDQLSTRQNIVLALLPDDYELYFQEKTDRVYSVVRNCLDFVVSLTDTSAVELYKKIHTLNH